MVPSAKLLAKIFAADAKCSVLTTLERDELRGLLLEAQESFTRTEGRGTGKRGGQSRNKGRHGSRVR